MPPGRFPAATALTLPVLALSAVPAWQFRHWPWICLALAAPVVVHCGRPLHRDALRHGYCGPTLPAALGTAGALAWSVSALLLGPAGDPGWTQAFPPDAAGPPVRLDVAAGATLALLLARYAGPPRSSRAAGPPPPTRPPSLTRNAGPPPLTRDTGPPPLTRDTGPPPLTRDTGPLPLTHGAGPGRAGRGVVPVVLAVAAGTLGYRLGSGGDPATAVSATLAVLLVAAPPAFRPRGATAAGTAGARDGRADATVTTVHVCDGEDPGQVLRLAGSVTERSAHPAGRAITGAASERGDVPAAAEVDERPDGDARGLVAELCPAGSGAVTVVAHAVLAGRPGLLAAYDIALPDDLDRIRETIEAAGRTAVAVAWDGRARGLIDIDHGPARREPGRWESGRRAEAPALLFHLIALPVAAAGALDPLLAGLAGALAAVALAGPAPIEPPGSARLGSPPLGSTPVGSTPTGSAPAGSAPAESAPAESAPAESAPSGSAPAGGSTPPGAATPGAAPDGPARPGPARER